MDGARVEPCQWWYIHRIKTVMAAVSQVPETTITREFDWRRKMRREEEPSSTDEFPGVTASREAACFAGGSGAANL